MPRIERLLRVLFTPKVMSMANFTAFGVVLAVGMWLNDLVAMSGSLGFFIAGACIGILYIADGWIFSEEMEDAPEEIAGRVVTDGVPKSKPKIQANLE